MLASQRRLALVVALAVAPLAVTVMARPASAQDARETERRDRALALIKEGRSRYDLGKFDEAIKLFEQAYEVYPFPEALYNLAQAWRQKGDLKRAAFYYRSYLRNKPDAPNRELVEQRIAELDELIQQQEQSRAKPPAGTQVPAASPGPPDPLPAAATVARQRDGRQARRWFADPLAWTVTGVGAVGLAVGGGFLYAASVKRDELATAGELELGDVRADADRRERIGVVSLVAGAAVAAVGAGLLIYNPAGSHTSVSASLSSGSVAAVVRYDF